MPLRCLLFSSNEQVRQPIWQILGELGIEGEYCERAVDAVERVTTQLFQIVITDWDDQPEASFLLKTARDLKATQRPLTLAIVSEDGKVPEALRAGANSVLMRPIRLEQVRDTMSTACQLLRSKQTFAAPAPIAASPLVTTAVAPKAAAGNAAAAAAPARTRETTEKAFRAGEFLTSSAPAPSTQFDTESEVRMDQVAPSEVEALTELEPMASAVETQAAEPAESQTPLTGWAALQERLTRSGAKKLEEAPKTDAAKNELLAYGEMSPSAESQLPRAQETKSESEKPRETKAEAALFAYMDGEAPSDAVSPRKTKKLAGVLCVSAVTVACLALFAMPQTRVRLQTSYRNAVHLARNWFNPQPVPVQQVAAQHETFTADEEYKLPVATNIPDATTDPSQIRVIPVIDPTVKPKNGDGSATQTGPGNVPTDQSSNANNGSTTPPPIDANGTQQTLPGIPSVAASPNLPNSAPNLSLTVSLPPPTPAAKTPTSTDPLRNDQTRNDQIRNGQPVPRPAEPVAALPATNSAAIPSSLRSQLASSTPDSSGTKPLEAAMAAIEPVNLPESAAWALLSQKVDPAYPDAAKASGQRGSVTLQVLIGRDGVVQDAKFLQGSLIFARAAIDAVKQWRFKPYLLNGRPASVQSVITINFKPTA